MRTSPTTLLFSSFLLLSSTVIACNTTEECNEGFYCVEMSQKCLPIGGCSNLLDCSNPANQPYGVNLCIGSLECQDNKCIMNCGGGIDEPDSALQEKNDNGINDSTSDPDPIPLDVPTTSFCQSNDECGNGEFCTLAGLCLVIGGCALDKDCFNDDNQPFPVALCFGDLQCQEGTCAMNCGVQPGPTVPGGDNGLSWGCAADSDCLEAEYCARGKCLVNGMCTSDSDCLNPKHIFADTMCIGYLECGNDGFCRRNCGMPCKDEKKEVQCTISACDTKIACPDAVSCVPDYCDECNAINFDAAGSVITDCTANTRDAKNSTGYAPCNSDSDCFTKQIDRSSSLDKNGWFCAQGVCMDMGSCVSDSDCNNPMNVFDDIRCSGFISCGDDGMCTRVCGESCKDGSKQIECPFDPCNRKDFCIDAVSCRANRCGGKCEAMYYNAAGEIIDECESVEADATVNDATDSTKTNPVLDDTKAEPIANDSSAMAVSVSITAVVSSLLLAFIN